jgi:hypothetical protein
MRIPINSGTLRSDLGRQDPMFPKNKVGGHPALRP